jgi:hypothetical protein
MDGTLYADQIIAELKACGLRIIPLTSGCAPLNCPDASHHMCRVGRHWGGVKEHAPSFGR